MFNIVKIIELVAKSRPIANDLIEQYLMKPFSMQEQLNKTGLNFANKKALFLGDDDHMSILYSYIFGTHSTVLELDDRIIKNQKELEKKLNIQKLHKILKFNAIYDTNTIKTPFLEYDIFYINPPYGSKNQLFGAKVWLSRCLEKLKINGKGFIVLPINKNYSWSIKNMLSFQTFVLENNCVIINIEKDIHFYFNHKDSDLTSTNIWIEKLSESKKLIYKIEQNLYR